MEDDIRKTTSMEEKPRQPQWKTTSMEDKLHGIRPQWKTNLIENKWRITSMEDNINGIQPRLKMTSMEDKEYDNISLPSKPIFSELGPAQPHLLYIINANCTNLRNVCEL